MWNLFVWIGEYINILWNLFSIEKCFDILRNLICSSNILWIKSADSLKHLSLLNLYSFVRIHFKLEENLLFHLFIAKSFSISYVSSHFFANRIKQFICVNKVRTSENDQVLRSLFEGLFKLKCMFVKFRSAN